MAVADGANVRLAPNVTAPYPEYEQLSPVVEVTVPTQPTAGARVALPGLRTFDPEVEVPLIFVSDTPDGPWLPLVAEAVPGRDLVVATTPHFSYLFARLFPIGGIVSEANKVFQQVTSGAFAEAPAPTCPAEAQARTEGWSVASAGPDTLKWCFGTLKSGRMLTVVNNRRYPLIVTHPGADQQSRTPSAVELANISQLTLPGKTVLLPRDSVTYRMAGSAQLVTEMDGLAQSLTALQTGAELASEITQLFGPPGDKDKLLDAALTSAKCLTVLQNVSEAGRIIRDCFTLEMIVDAFGPAAAFAAALLVLAPVLEFFRSSFNALGDQLNGRDRYKISVGYTKPAPPATPPLDPKCKQGSSDEVGLCRFVIAVQTGNLSALSAEEKKVAATVKDLPKRAWTITSCELVGDVTVLCEIGFAGTPANSEPAAAAFTLGPVGGEYNAESGGYDVPSGGKVTYEVNGYEGLGVNGSFSNS